MFFNGVLDSNNTVMFNASLLNVTRSFNYFGWSTTNSSANQSLDEIKFYNRALSAAEVLADYNTNGSLISYV
jgi:hypothetical protein